MLYDECSICFEGININDYILYDDFLNNYNDISSSSSIKTHCGHFFHSQCLYTNNLKYSTCPICRRSFTNNIINLNDNSNNNINNSSNINVTVYNHNNHNSHNNIAEYSQYFLIKLKIPYYRNCYYIYIHKYNFFVLILLSFIFILLIASMVLLILSYIYD